MALWEMIRGFDKAKVRKLVRSCCGFRGRRRWFGSSLGEVARSGQISLECIGLTVRLDVKAKEEEEIKNVHFHFLA